MNVPKQTPVEWMSKYLRVTNYLGAAQLYLRSNFLLEEELTPDHIKRRILGHWGTVPGLNFIWACLNVLVSQTDQELLAVWGPGHGYPAIQANLFVDGTLGEFFKNYNIAAESTEDRKSGFEKLIRDFSWPGGFPSHSNPLTPGCILEGGELGYSLSTSFGAVLDNPNLIAATIVGDGEAETGPLAAAWHSTKFLNPITSGAVLPILHVNGYKISGPTLFGTMSNAEIISYFKGLNYEPIIVEGEFLFEPMLAALTSAHQKIRAIQDEARSTGIPGLPCWPVIILRSDKGWFGPRGKSEDLPIIGSHRSHGIPLEHPQTDMDEFYRLKEWLESYNVRELITDSYTLRDDLYDYVPSGDLRLGMAPAARAVGSKDLNLPVATDMDVKFDIPGKELSSSTNKLAEYMRELFRLNEAEQNFRLFSPDETDSNKLHSVFEVTNRAYLPKVKDFDENLAPDGRVMEILSEHTLVGWMQGYTLTGRHGIFITYEAFAEIVSSMFDQYTKFIRHASEVSWRNPVPSLNIVLTSLNWRQDHNGFSHQNPGFISSVLNNHTDLVDVYFPVDSNSMLAVSEQVFKSRNRVNVIVAGKRPIQQWLTLEEAKQQIEQDMMIWERHSDEDPDIVFVGCGDYASREMLAARILLKRLIPEIKIRFVNITQLSCFGIGDNRRRCNLNALKFDDLFTEDKPVIFNYHGYDEDIKALIFNHHAAARFSIHGFSEVGTTTTPFDMLVKNHTDRFSIAIEAIELSRHSNKVVEARAIELTSILKQKLRFHKEYVHEHGVDMDEIDDFEFVL